MSQLCMNSELFIESIISESNFVIITDAEIKLFELWSYNKLVLIFRIWDYSIFGLISSNLQQLFPLNSWLRSWVIPTFMLYCGVYVHYWPYVWQCTIYSINLSSKMVKQQVHSIMLSGLNNLNAFHETKLIKQHHLGLKLGWTYLTLLFSGGGGLPYPALIHMKINLLQRFGIKVFCELTHPSKKWS